MGLVKVTGELASADGEFKPVEFLVDTGSLYTLVSPEIARELGVELVGSTTLETAEGSHVEVAMGYARIRLMGREKPTLLGAMNVPMPLLGSGSLQSLGLKVNPVAEILEYDIPYPPLV